MRPVVLLLLAYTSSIYAQDPAKIRSFKIYSNILKEDRFFEAYVPASTAKKLEVIFVLDGQAQFATVINALKARGENQKLVIGLNNLKDPSTRVVSSQICS